MYQYIQGWEIGIEQLDWLWKHEDWNDGLDLFGERIWIKVDGDVCIVKSLWSLFKLGIIGKLGKGYYSYCEDDTCYVVYRFGWCWNSNRVWPTMTVWDLLIDRSPGATLPTKIQPNLKKSKKSS